MMSTSNNDTTLRKAKRTYEDVDGNDTVPHGDYKCHKKNKVSPISEVVYSKPSLSMCIELSHVWLGIEDFCFFFIIWAEYTRTFERIWRSKVPRQTIDNGRYEIVCHRHPSMGSSYRVYKTWIDRDRSHEQCHRRTRDYPPGAHWFCDSMDGVNEWRLGDWLIWQDGPNLE